MAEVTQTLLRWSPSRTTEYSIALVLDDADFDTDPITGEIYRRILRVVVNNTSQRDCTLIFGARNLLRIPTALTGPQTNRIFAIAGRRTEQEFSWDFTPNHVDIMPGSVSNPSLLTSGGNATGSSSDVTAAFTPTADSLLVVAWSALSDFAGEPTFTFTNTHVGSGAWASVEVFRATNRRHAQGRCQMGATPGSGTITNTYSANCTRKARIISEVTGHDTTTPLSESNTGDNAATTLDIALVAIAAGNLAIGTVSSGGATNITAGTNETELAEAASGGANEERIQLEYGTDTTVNWTNLNTLNNRGVAIEYAQAAGGGGGGVGYPTQMFNARFHGRGGGRGGHQSGRSNARA